MARVEDCMQGRASLLCFAFAILIACFVATGCGGKKIRTAKAPRIGATERGVASWYGHPYHGRRAANGEIYDMERLTAAHRTLPFDTWLRVKNLSNDKTVDVRIQDRGPFVKGRIIDLSHAAAREIAMIGPGTTKVLLTVIAPPQADAREKSLKQAELFAVQVGAYRERSRAEAVRQDMSGRYGSARLVERSASPPVWRVLVGEEQTSEEAEALAERIRSAGAAAFVVRIDNTER